MSDLMDLLDDFVLGPMDWIDKLIAPLALRSVRMDKIRIPRADKTGGATLNETLDHLRKHGVDCTPAGFNSSEMSFYVRRSQRRWLDWLLRYDSAGAVILVNAKRRWKEAKR